MFTTLIKWTYTIYNFSYFIKLLAQNTVVHQGRHLQEKPLVIAVWTRHVVRACLNNTEQALLPVARVSLGKFMIFEILDRDGPNILW